MTVSSEFWKVWYTDTVYNKTEAKPLIFKAETAEKAVSKFYTEYKNHLIVTKVERLKYESSEDSDYKKWLQARAERATSKLVTSEGDLHYWRGNKNAYELALEAYEKYEVAE